MRKVILLTVLLCGCSSPEQDAMELEQAKERACANMGAPKDSEKYFECRKFIEQDIANQLATQYQQQYITTAPLQIPTLQTNKQTNCVTTTLGNSLNTHCN